MRVTRFLHGVHQWCGLIAGLNMLLLSITGAYLVFAEDIEHFFGEAQGPLVATMEPGANTPIQAAVDHVAAMHPEAKLTGVRPMEPGAADMGITLFQEPDTLHRYVFDPATREIRAEVESTAMAFNHFILHLHADLFLGMIGVLFLGVIAFLFLLATLSGLFIYAPFMKQALFGALRFDRGVRRSSADLHKLVGSASLLFNLVIAITGVALTFGIVGARMWGANEVRTRTAAVDAAAMTPPAKLPPIDTVLTSAAAVHPEAPVSSVVMPGSFQGPAHYFVFHERQGKLEKFMPVYSLVSANFPDKAEDIAVPLWIDLTMASIPLHFGNYGGPVIKVVYSFLGLGSGLLSVSGAILTITRWRKKWRIKKLPAGSAHGQLQPEAEGVSS